MNPHNDHSSCSHPTVCACGSAVTAEAHFPETAQSLEELAHILSGGIIVQSFYLCDSCLDFAIQVLEEVNALEEVAS